VGAVGFLDPAKDSAAPAMKRLIALGVEVKVLTGDTAIVCEKLCREINLPVKRTVTSDQLAKAAALEDPSELRLLATEGTIFARLTPLQKSLLIETLRAEKHVDGFMGDGINDSVALHQADVGISVDDAVDVAKEAADIILLEQSLEVVADGVVIGRTVFANIVKYIKMAMSSNFGNAFSVTIAACWLPFLPQLPIHIVVGNLIYDLTQLAIPWDNADPEMLATPRNWSMKSMLRFLIIGPISSIFDVTTFLFLWFRLGLMYNVTSDPTANPFGWTCEPSPTDLTGHLDHCSLLFQTGWFVEGLATQVLIVHMIRTPKWPFIQSIAAFPLVAASVLAIIVGCSLPYIPVLNTYLNMQPLPSIYWAYFVGCILSYMLLTQVIKMIYLRVFAGDWI